MNPYYSDDAVTIYERERQHMNYVIVHGHHETYEPRGWFTSRELADEWLLNHETPSGEWFDLWQLNADGTIEEIQTPSSALSPDPSTRKGTP